MTRPASYDRVSQALHWGAAAITIVLLAAGVLMQWIEPGALKLNVYRSHVVFGALAGGLTLARAGWSFRRQRPVELHASGAHRLAVHALHVGLVLVTAALVLTGFGTVVASGLTSWLSGSTDVLPDLFSFPPRLGHRVAAVAFSALLVGHVAGVVVHQVRKGGALERMGVSLGLRKP